MKYLTIPTLAVTLFLTFKLWAGGVVQPIDIDQPILMEEPSSDTVNSSSSDATKKISSSTSASNKGGIASSSDISGSLPANHSSTKPATNTKVINVDTPLVVTPETTQKQIDDAIKQGRKIIHMGVYDDDKNPVLDSKGNPVISPIWKSKNL